MAFWGFVSGLGSNLIFIHFSALPVDLASKFMSSLHSSLKLVTYRYQDNISPKLLIVMLYVFKLLSVYLFVVYRIHLSRIGVVESFI